MTTQTINDVPCKVVEQVNNVIHVCFKNIPMQKVAEIQATLCEKYNNVDNANMHMVHPISCINNNMTGYFACST